MAPGRRRPRAGFLRRHSLSLAAAGVLLAWIVLYVRADPRTRAGAFFGNAIADWSGVVCLVVATKYFFERGSEESRPAPALRRGSIADFLLAHSLTLVLALTGLVWLWLYLHMDPNAKWGQVVGNVLSEWVQMIGLVLLTKGLFEEHSRESHGVR